MAKFKKNYNDVIIEKTVNFFRKRMSDKKESKICDSVENILKECEENTRNKLILHLNKFAKWYSKYYMQLPNADFKMVYFKSVCSIWKKRNNDKMEVIGLDKSDTIRTHIMNLFAALFTSERHNLYNFKHEQADKK